MTENTNENRQMKLIVAGSRKFIDHSLLECKIEWFLNVLETKPEDTIIISGTARGADQLGEKYAKENNMEVIRMPADWNSLGKRAGFVRNQEMAKKADACIVFWDEESRGSMHMIDISRKQKIPLCIVKYKTGETETILHLKDED